MCGGGREEHSFMDCLGSTLVGSALPKLAPPTELAIRHAARNPAVLLYVLVTRRKLLHFAQQNNPLPSEKTLPCSRETVVGGNSISGVVSRQPRG